MDVSLTVREALASRTGPLSDDVAPARPSVIGDAVTTRSVVAGVPRGLTRQAASDEVFVK